MSRYIEGQDRQQATLLPECLDDFIAEDNTVRIVDVFINELDLVGLGFDGAKPAATGRPSYHPSVLLKHYNGVELKVCQDAGIAAYVPKPMTSNAKAAGRYDKTDFIYIARDDEYQCPAGQRATHRFTTDERGLQIHVYWSSACPGCSQRHQCTTSKYRRIRRWEHEEVMDAVQQRLDREPYAMKVRRRTIEHVFGTLKHWMGSTHFLTRGLQNMASEMSLHVLAYNFKRVISILGFERTKKAMQLLGA